MALPLVLVAALGAVPSPGPAAEARAPGREHVLAGEIVRVDLTRRAVTLRTVGREPREFEVAVEEGKTRVTWAGRAVPLEDVRPGEAAVALCSDDASGHHRARLLKIGPSSYAVPAPAAPKRP